MKDKEMKTGGLELPTGILFEDDDHIHVAGPIIREGVFNGALQEYKDFQNDIPSLIGLRYIRGEHPKDESGKFRPVQDSDDIIGSLIDAKGVPNEKLAWGTWDLNKRLLTQAEIDALHAGEPIGTSPGYWCDEEKTGKPEIYIPTGEIYYKIEHGPRIFDHIASPKVPACKRCGPLHAQGGKSLAIGEGDSFPGICFNKFVVKGLWSDDELKKMIGDVMALDPMKVSKDAAMEKLLTQILLGLDAAPIKIQSQEAGMETTPKIDMKLLVQSEEFKQVVSAVTTEALKEPLEKLRIAEETIASQKEELKKVKSDNETLLSDKTSRDEAAIKAAQDKATETEKNLKEMFISWLKPGKEVTEAEALWATAKTNPWQFRIENPGHFVVQSQATNTRFSPAASTKSSEGSKEVVRREDGLIVKADSGDIDWAAMGIKSPEILAEELGYNKTAGGK